MFNKAGFNDIYRAKWDQLQKRILSESDAFIIGSPTNELVAYYLSNNSFDAIEFDPSRNETAEHVKQIRKVPEHHRDSFYGHLGDTDFEYESIVIRLPIIRNPNIRDFAELRTSTFSVSWSPKDWGLSQDTLTLTIDIKGYGFNYSDDESAMASKIEREKSNLMQWIGWVNNDIAKENAALDRNLREFIESRKSKLQADKGKIGSLIKRINIPLKKTENQAEQRIRLDHAPLVKKARPSPTVPENYVLDAQKVLDIVSVIDNQGRQFERTPTTYDTLGEEDLRNIILVGLNSLFEGKATGETFSAKGKTDIYLNIDKGNILVCECKFWGGEKRYLETIGQLLGYLTWRHNFGIIINFVKVKNLTKILDSISEVIPKHDSFSTGVRKISDTHFISSHRLNQDDDKDAELHHLFYNLYHRN
jgi:hypothetical protein